MAKHDWKMPETDRAQMSASKGSKAAKIAHPNNSPRTTDRKKLPVQTEGNDSPRAAT